MTPASFLAWRQRLGLDKKAAAKALGCSRNALINWERGYADLTDSSADRGYKRVPRPIPRYIALACAAIAQGVPPIN